MRSPSSLPYPSRGQITGSDERGGLFPPSPIPRAHRLSWALQGPQKYFVLFPRIPLPCRGGAVILGVMRETVTVVKVEDHEYEGTCGACGKEGVRWVVTLSDGSRVGGECAKKLLGWAPTAKKFSWVTGLTPLVEEMIDGEAIVVWANQTRTRGGISINGHPQMFGPLEWIKSEYQNRFAIYK